VSRLDSASAILPDDQLFLYAYVRKEAVLSSQIEGTQSSLSDLLLFESEGTPSVPLDDAREVSNYVAALQHGLHLLQTRLPLSNRLLREIHRVLLSSGRGRNQMPGEFRRSQNWIGGRRPGSATFVPPPHTAIADCMTDFERFLHSEDDGLSVLLRAGLAHVQFETIHPFLDGNGRVGRLLITLQLCHAKLLRAPLLYLSLYFKQHRSDYYGLLGQMRSTGDWEEWLSFFLTGVKQTAEGAVSTADRLVRLFGDDRAKIQGTCGRRASSVLRVHDALTKRPVLSLAEACRETKLAFATVAAAMRLLVDRKLAREITGRSRDRLFAYNQYLEILSEGTEPL
ncbi:MAG: Fic family protein, partial [Bryobacterales bacterium]|nr:Fic family protein [Bryobacterales bacterium]